MTARRSIALAAAAALALLLAWLAWPTDRASGPGALAARAHQARTAPAAARRAASPTRTQTAPATSAPVAVETGIPACDDYVARAMTCGELPADARIALVEATKAWARLPAADRPALESSCRATAAVQGDALTAMGC